MEQGLDGNAGKGKAMARRWIGMLLLTGCVSSHGDADQLQGAGVVRRIRIPADRDPVWCGRSFDGRFVLFDTTAPDPQIICMDVTFKKVASVESAGGALAPSCTGPTMLYAPGGSYELLEIPSLTCVDILRVRGDDAARQGSMNAVAICGTADGTWIRVSDRGDILEILPSPLRLGRSARATIKSVRAAALDAKDAKLIICGDGATVEVFDVTSWKPAGTVALGHEASVQRVVAGNGTAWLATSDGRVLGVDSKRAVVRATLDVSGVPERVHNMLDLSMSGRFLGVVSVGDRAGPSRVVLRVFDLGGDEAKECSSAEVTLPDAVWGITILEKEEAVVLESPHPAVWYYKREAATR
jgi:hypothetical protein